MSEIQSIAFSREIWTKKQAVRWLKEHKFKPIKPVDPTNTFWRYRLHKPEKFKQFSVKALNNGVNLILGFK